MNLNEDNTESAKQNSKRYYRICRPNNYYLNLNACYELPRQKCKTKIGGELVEKVQTKSTK